MKKKLILGAAVLAFAFCFTILIWVLPATAEPTPTPTPSPTLVATFMEIDAPDEVGVGCNFIAYVYPDPAIDYFDAANYDVSYNPARIVVTDVTDGLIGGTVIPVVNWSLVPVGVQGTVRISNDVPGSPGITGSGYLAQIHFDIIGSVCQTSVIDFPYDCWKAGNCILYDNYGREILAGWTWYGGESVHISTGPCEYPTFMPTPTASPTPSVSPTISPTVSPTPTVSATPTSCANNGLFIEGTNNDDDAHDVDVFIQAELVDSVYVEPGATYESGYHYIILHNNISIEWYDNDDKQTHSNSDTHYACCPIVPPGCTPMLMTLDIYEVLPNHGDVNTDGRINCLDITQCELCILYPGLYPKEDYPGWDANEDDEGPNAGDILAVELRILELWPP